jgi:hypothetical protein
LKKFKIKEVDNMNPEKIMEGLMKELGVALKSMSNAKSLEEKVAHSQIVKNLCESLGVFLDLATNMMDYEEE